MVAKHAPDRRRTDPEAELAQFLPGCVHSPSCGSPDPGAR
jgi:hypothetical protein